MVRSGRAPPTERPLPLSKSTEADDGSRTRDLRLGKPTLYQLSYVRAWRSILPIAPGILSPIASTIGRMSDSQELVISIDRRLAEARKEIASLEAALAAMSAQTPPTATATSARTAPRTATTTTTSAPGRKPRGSATPTTSSGRRRAKPARLPEVVPAGKLETLLTSTEGLTTADLVARTGGDRQQLLTLLRELEAAGRVRRSGERRSTRWHAITDEDRIAARVAELERQRAQPAEAGAPRKARPLAKVS